MDLRARLLTADDGELSCRAAAIRFRMAGMVAPMVLDRPIDGDWFEWFEAYVTQMLIRELPPAT